MLLHVIQEELISPHLSSASTPCHQLRNTYTDVEHRSITCHTQLHTQESLQVSSNLIKSPCIPSQHQSTSYIQHQQPPPYLHERRKNPNSSNLCHMRHVPYPSPPKFFNHPVSSISRTQSSQDKSSKPEMNNTFQVAN